MGGQQNWTNHPAVIVPKVPKRQGSSSYIQILGPIQFKVWGLGFRLSGLGFRVHGLGFRVRGLGFRIQGLGLKVPCRGRMAQNADHKILSHEPKPSTPSRV